MQTPHSNLSKRSGFRICIIVVQKSKHKDNKRSPSRCVLLTHFGVFFLSQTNLTFVLRFLILTNTHSIKEMLLFTFYSLGTSNLEKINN